jgi:hypothetical protein
VAYIQNEGAEPELTDFCDAEGHHLNDEGWSQVSSRFATLCQLQSPRRHRDHVEEILSHDGITLFSKVRSSSSDSDGSVGRCLVAFAAPTAAV